MSSDKQASGFDNLGLPEPILRAVRSVGYENPSPIQAQCIPVLLEGNDIIGQAQTGTGKTAAFALPLLSRIDSKSKHPQLLVLTPTRELALQVAEACQSYAKHLNNFHVLPIYGGSSYSTQLRQLKRGVQVIVGTPGRVMDHMRKGTLKLDDLQALVLDEADEMLRMGFIDDVEWVLSHTNDDCQIALFSATMPKPIRKVASQYLTDPVEIKIEAKTNTASTIKQRFLAINHREKLDAMTRILESEDFEGVIVFVRTKTATVELADKLNARGFAAEALNGDIPQDRREKIVSKLKKGTVDLLVATDVAARGLDVDRISHVINYDIPTDTESYIHRIGRTGRAGREGAAILFVTPRERRLLKAIEQAAGKSIDKMHLPGIKEVNASRIARFKQNVVKTLENNGLDNYRSIINELINEQDLDSNDVAAALAYLLQGDQPLLLDEPAPERKGKKDTPRESKPKRLTAKASPLKDFPEIKMRRYRVEVGYAHKVKPGNLVGAIANEAEIESCYIGDINIYDDFSTVDLPDGMPGETFKALKNTWVCDQKLNIQAVKEEQGAKGKKKPSKRKTEKKPKASTSKKKRNTDTKKSERTPSKRKRRS